MTYKQRILAAARGEKLDQLPFGARIDLWYNYHHAHGTLPKKYQDWTMADIIRDQGVGVYYRGFAAVKETYPDIETVEKKEPTTVTTELHTPHGVLTKKEVLDTSEGSAVKYELEKLFKSEKDYPALTYLMEHTVPVSDYTLFRKMNQEVGEDGIVSSAAWFWSPAQRVMRELLGYELFFYELADHPDKVLRLIEAVENLERRKLQLALDVEIEVYQVCANWSDEIHTPVFRRFFVPWLQEVSALLHSKGKLAMVHIDGEMKRLNHMFRETGVDIGEAVTPAPQTRVSMKEFREQIGPDVTLWGGIPTILFQPQYTNEQFDDYVKQMLKDVAPGYRFIVGMGDNLPFDGDIERVRRVVELVEKYGKLPIEGIRLY